MQYEYTRLDGKLGFEKCLCSPQTSDHQLLWQVINDRTVLMIMLIIADRQMIQKSFIFNLQHGWKQQRVPCRVERLPARGVRGQERLTSSFLPMLWQHCCLETWVSSFQLKRNIHCRQEPWRRGVWQQPGENIVLIADTSRLHLSILKMKNENLFCFMFSFLCRWKAFLASSTAQTVESSPASTRNISQGLNDTAESRLSYLAQCLISIIQIKSVHGPRKKHFII